MRSIGVQVRDSEDDFRNMTNIMSDIGKVWNSLTDTQKSKVGYEVAGTRQLNILNSSFGAYDEYSSIINTIDKRTGEALENQEIYADSLQGHLGDIAATTESIWNNVFDTEQFKGTLSFFNTLLSLLDKLTGFLGTDSILANAIGLLTVNNLGLD